MFNPSNLDEVCVQVTHLEARERTLRKRVIRRIHSRVRKKRKEENGREKRMKVQKKKGRKLYANIAPKLGIMRPIVGNYILN